VAHESNSELIFPLEESGDTQMLQKCAFESCREVIYERLHSILNQQSDNQPEFTAVSSALLQAICFSNQQEQQDLTQRIFLIQLSKDDPA